MKGLICGIFESKRIGNCSNDGISSKVGSVTLIGEGVPEIFEANEEAPAVKIVRRNIGGDGYIHAEPVEEAAQIGYMMGGCFIWTSDSRFPNSYPIPLHDRQESHELNEALSR